MCTTCGCGQASQALAAESEHGRAHSSAIVRTQLGGAARGEGEAVRYQVYRHGDGTASTHAHDLADLLGRGHGHRDHHSGDLHYGLGPARAHAPGLSQARVVRIEQDILAKNDAFAASNRARLAELGIFALNLVSSPGSGKTTLLVKTLAALMDKNDVAVIEGDQETSRDADCIRATGARALQINTGKGCHLDAEMIGRAIGALAPSPGSVLMIENVGNLVCPAAFDLGEAHKVVVLSVTEGEDKPLKYPDMFRRSSLMLLNKIDLLPYLDFDAGRCIEYARRVNPKIEVIELSALRGEGMDRWLAWVERGVEDVRCRSADALRARLAELERQAASLRKIVP